MTRLEYVWGVDVAVARLAFAFAPMDGSQIQVETLHTGSDAREGQRLGWIDRQVRIYAGQQAGKRWPAACVWVEQPSGRFRNPQLLYTAGVVQAALFEALAVPVWTIPSSTWKQRTVGKGNATKEQVSAWVTAQGAGFNGQDEADAYAIGAAGRGMLVSGSWDATAHGVAA